MRMQTEQIPSWELQRPVTVVLVDDEPLIRGAIAQALSSSGLELVGEAANGEEAVKIVLDVRPDVVLIDPGFLVSRASRQSSSSGCSLPCRVCWC